MNKWPKALVCFVVWGIFWLAIYIFNGFNHFGLHCLCFLLGSPFAVSFGVLYWECYQDQREADKEKWRIEQEWYERQKERENR